ncbi:hypothetical protein F7725_027227, partial [Dissostichus mawsoni]
FCTRCTGAGLWTEHAQQKKGGGAQRLRGSSDWSGSNHGDRRGSQNSTLQAGKVSSCMATVLLLPNTVMLSSLCRSWVSWYHSCIASESKQSLQDAPGGLLSLRVVSTDHVVRGSEASEQILIHGGGGGAGRQVGQIHDGGFTAPILDPPREFLVDGLVSRLLVVFSVDDPTAFALPLCVTLPPDPGLCTDPAVFLVLPAKLFLFASESAIQAPGCGGNGESAVIDGQSSVHGGTSESEAFGRDSLTEVGGVSWLNADVLLLL